MTIVNELAYTSCDSKKNIRRLAPSSINLTDLTRYDCFASAIGRSSSAPGKVSIEVCVSKAYAHRLPRTSK